MKILFLAQLLPYPPVCGGTIKSFNTLRHLGSRHEVTLLSFVRREPTSEDLAALGDVCAEVRTVPIARSGAANLRFATKSITGEKPFIVSRDFVPEMQRSVDQLLHADGFDLLYVDHLQMAQYVLDFHGCPKVLDEHNVEWKIIQRIAEVDRSTAKRLFAAVEWRKLRRWELAACERFDQIFTVSETDRGTLAAANPRIPRVTTVPIGVDFDVFSPIIPTAEAQDVVTLGTMNWPPNVDGVLYFAKHIFPRIRRQVPGARFVVAGKNPPTSITRLGVRGSSIEVTGFIDDPTEVLSNAAAFVVPLRSGSGLRVKILNAMAMGLPIVTTSVGCEGIGAVNGRDIIVADDDQEFAAAVVRLIQDFGFRQEIAKNGRAFVLENYAWDRIFERLDSALNGLRKEALSCSRAE